MTELAGAFARKGGDVSAGVDWAEHAGAPLAYHGRRFGTHAPVAA